MISDNTYLKAPVLPTLLALLLFGVILTFFVNKLDGFCRTCVPCDITYGSRRWCWLVVFSPRIMMAYETKVEFRTGNWSLKWIKFFLFMTNLMFVFTGVLVIATGVAVESVYKNFTSFVDEQFYSPTMMFIAVGVITLAIATFGFIGTFKESALLINIYCGILTVVFLLEVTATSVGIYHRREVDGILMQTLNSSLQRYPWNSNLQESVDFMQIELECCGVTKYQDWEDVFAVVDLDSGVRAELPASCCQFYQDGCVPFQTGCYQKMYALLRHCLKTVISGLLLVAFVQISAAMFSFILGKRIRMIKTKCSLDRSKYQETICSFDYRRLNEISNEKPMI